MPRPSRVITHLSEEEITAADEPVLGRIATLLRPYRSQLMLVAVAVITAAILTVTWGAARQVLARLMDAVDPSLVERAVAALQGVAGVVGVDRVRLRWIGHALRAEVDLSVSPGVSIERAHTIAHAAEHELTHAVPRLTAATVHAHPARSPAAH